MHDYIPSSTARNLTIACSPYHYRSLLQAGATTSTIPCLSLTQPWATLVALGAKQIETRSWPTRYRGWLGIHAAIGFPAEARTACLHTGIAARLRRAGLASPDDLPRGVVLAIARLVDCRRIDAGLRAGIGPEEQVLGDYQDGRYAWVLREARSLPNPIPARGRLGLWQPSPEVHDELAKVLHIADPGR